MPADVEDEVGLVVFAAPFMRVETQFAAVPPDPPLFIDVAITLEVGAENVS